MDARFSAGSLRHLKSVFLLVAALLIASHFSLNLMRNGAVFLDTEAYSNLQEKRPYQYRLLMVPIMGRLIESFSRPRPKAILATMPTYVSTPEMAAYFVIDVVSLTASYLLMIAISRLVFGAATAPFVVAVYIVMTYLFFCLNPNLSFILPYDLPSLALSQGCILALLKRRWVRLYVLFTLATVNRETNFLIIIFMAAAATNVRGRQWRSMIHIAVLSIIWLTIKIALQQSFTSAPLDGGERVTYNLMELAKPWQWPALMPLVASFVLTLLTLRRPGTQPQWAITGCVGFFMLFLVAQITETRSYGDLMVYFAMAIGSWIAAAYSRAAVALPAKTEMR